MKFIRDTMLEGAGGEYQEDKSQLVELFTQFTDKVGGDPVQLAETLIGRYEVDTHPWGYGYMPDVLAYLKKTVIPHKIAVYESGVELIASDWFSPLIFKPDFLFSLWMHDLSKFSSYEAVSYANYNFATKQGKEQFELGWHHHKQHNPHHPEYWLNPNRSGVLEPLPMGEMFIHEMIADWMGAGEIYGTPLSEWLPKNISKFLFEKSTTVRVAEIIGHLGFTAAINENTITV